MTRARTLAILVFILFAVFPAACFSAPAKKAAKKQPVKQKAISEQELLDRVFQTFRKQKIKSMAYDEYRTVSTKIRATGADDGMMSLDKENSTTYIMRNFYRAPDRHGYRMLTDPVNGFWPGSPKQENAIAMDERWKEKVRTIYRLVLSPGMKEVRKRKCYVLNLMPYPGNKLTFPMTWYIDSKDFTIIKFIHLIRSPGKTVSTTGEIFYGKVKGYTVPVSAEWVSTVSNVMLSFHYAIRYDNYLFNIPLDDSVFKEQPLPPPSGE